MSTKIHQAWRVPVARLNEALLAVQAESDRIIGERLKPLIEAFERAPQLASLDLWNLIGASQVTPERSTFEDVGLFIQVDVDLAYLRPYGPYWVTEPLKVPDWFEDYHYQNSTDGPKWAQTPEGRVKWEARREHWFELVKKPCLRFTTFDLTPRSGRDDEARIERLVGAGWFHRSDEAEKRRGKPFEGTTGVMQALKEVEALKPQPEAT